MPQIWMTYDELADLTGYTGSDARGLAISLSLDRKKSRDGLSRAKLNADLSQRFFARIREENVDVDHAVDQLRQIHSRMLRHTEAERGIENWRQVAR